MWLISIFHCRQPSRTSLIMRLSIKDGAGSCLSEMTDHDQPKRRVTILRNPLLNASQTSILRPHKIERCCVDEQYMTRKYIAHQSVITSHQGAKGV